MKLLRTATLLCCTLFILPVAMAGEAVVSRIVVVGDLHGDYEQFVSVLRDAGVVNRRDRWVGGQTRLVQIGDVPDRGPDSARIIRLLMSLERQAEREGGAVHALIGNHEAMVMQGDLRYVHPGEYEALTDRASGDRQRAYYKKYVDWYKANTPEDEWPKFNSDFFAQWKKQFPKGYVEHRNAWAPDGEFGRWVLGHDAVLLLDRTLFVHGGIDPLGQLLPLKDINRQVRAELAKSTESGPESIINVPDGPLWYRGLAVGQETAGALSALQAMLDFYGADRIVIAHTPLMGAVVPRFGGRVLLADVGLAAHYGAERSLLLIENDRYVAMVNGRRIPLPGPDDDLSATLRYFDTVMQLVKIPQKVRKYVERTYPGATIPVPPESDDSGVADAG